MLPKGKCLFIVIYRVIITYHLFISILIYINILNRIYSSIIRCSSLKQEFLNRYLDEIMCIKTTYTDIFLQNFFILNYCINIVLLMYEYSHLSLTCFGQYLYGMEKLLDQNILIIPNTCDTYKLGQLINIVGEGSLETHHNIKLMVAHRGNVPATSYSFYTFILIVLTFTI